MSTLFECLMVSAFCISIASQLFCYVRSGAMLTYSTVLFATAKDDDKKVCKE